ncbi:MAG: lactate racemase domain-containing protein [Paludisphaera borealis]|uniref:lactate racemase domain-containing protein n=1 Tax=Paludisphaera borealis TaxID=1387353 RepID=UPI00285019B7|nr:lactate racemase domain-containing protein [Paludisphaera borealis]MDR3619676.1 lactate racemase domain-containing protein [Paludisphaera borealis]
MGMGPIEAPWGADGVLRLEFPDDWRVGRESVFEPDLAGAVADYPSALEAALDAPLDSPRLEELVRGGSKVALVVDDPSRWTPVREALPIVLRRLHAAGVAERDVTISVGVGRHHAVDDQAMRRRLGDDVAARYACFSPPVDDLSAYEDLGTTSQGVPIRVFRPVAQADARILIGSVLPHLQAGFGGGYKLIFPGTSHRTTLGALHRQGLSADSDAGRLLGGCASGNPMRRAIHEAAGRLGPCVSISHLIGSPGMIFGVVAGRPESVQDRLAAAAKGRFEAPPALPADVVVVGNHPWPGDPMQSFKVLLHHRAASRPGGVLVGLFWTDPDEIDRSMPRSAMRLIAGSGAPGGWAIRRLVPLAERILSTTGSSAAFMLRWARELVVDRTVLVYSPPLYDRIGGRLGPVRLFGDQAELWRVARRSLGASSREPTVRVFPRGGLSYAPQRETT